MSQGRFRRPDGLRLCAILGAPPCEGRPLTRLGSLGLGIEPQMLDCRCSLHLPASWWRLWMLPPSTELPGQELSSCLSPPPPLAHARPHRHHTPSVTPVASLPALLRPQAVPSFPQSIAGRPRCQFVTAEPGPKFSSCYGTWPLAPSCPGPCPLPVPRRPRSLPCPTLSHFLQFPPHQLFPLLAAWT